MLRTVRVSGRSRRLFIRAAWRRAALVEIFKTEAEPKKSADSKAASSALWSAYSRQVSAK